MKQKIRFFILGILRNNIDERMAHRNKTSDKASSEALNEALNADVKHLVSRRTLQHMIAEDMLQQMFKIPNWNLERW